MPEEAPTKGVIFPICACCGADPLKFKRVRYDFPDGVLVETFFCSRCRRIISCQIVGLEKPRRR
jgi:hypothetical protein